MPIPSHRRIGLHSKILAEEAENFEAEVAEMQCGDDRIPSLGDSKHREEALCRERLVYSKYGEWDALRCMPGGR